MTIRGTASIAKIAMTIYTKLVANVVMTFAEMMYVITTMNRTAKTVMTKINDSIIHDYYYKPDPIFYGKGQPHYGIELEIDEGGEYDDNAERILNIGNRINEHIYCKHDGSLDDGFEIVSHPATLEYHTNTIPWKKILDEALEMGYYSHNSGTCGLHVHINRAALGESVEEQENTIARIVYFFEKFLG